MGSSEQGKAGALGERNLSTVHAVAQALAIGPMFSVALVLGGISRPDIGAGWNAPLAVLVAALGVLAIGYVIVLYARRFAGAGAVYEYLTHGSHPWTGVATAGVFFLGVLFLGGGGIYLGTGILAEGFWKSHISDRGPSWWVFGLIALAIVLVLNYVGIRIAVGAMLTFAVVSFIPSVLDDRARRRRPRLVRLRRHHPAGPRGERRRACGGAPRRGPTRRNPRLRLGRRGRRAVA